MELDNIPSLDGEEWRDITGYEGLYMVSNLGRVKGLDRVFYKPYKGKIVKVNYGGKIIKLLDSSGGYIRIGLNKSKGYKSINVHRLVALAFIPQEEGKDQVNHKDGDKKNNRVDNLEWCTNSENQKHRYGVLKKKSKLAKPIIQMDIYGNYIDTFDHAKIASIKLGLWQSDIARACGGKLKTCGGFKWSYVTEELVEELRRRGVVTSGNIINQ